MFVLITERTLKRNTGATETFAPRSANYTASFVSGPFRTLTSASDAAKIALSTHTCLSAMVWSRAQVEAQRAKYLRDIDKELFATAWQLIEAGESATQPLTK